MKNLILSIAIILVTTFSAQAQVSSATGSKETVKSFRMGNMKLIEVNKDGLTSYELLGTCANATSYEMTVVLGDVDKAIATLESLSTYKPGKRETVNLNNVGGNTAEYNKFNAVWMIFGSGKTLHINVSRKELASMAKALKGGEE